MPTMETLWCSERILYLGRGVELSDRPCMRKTEIDTSRVVLANRFPWSWAHRLRSALMVVDGLSLAPKLAASDGLGVFGSSKYVASISEELARGHATMAWSQHEPTRTSACWVDIAH